MERTGFPEWNAETWDTYVPKIPWCRSWNGLEDLPHRLFISKNVFFVTFRKHALPQAGSFPHGSKIPKKWWYLLNIWHELNQLFFPSGSLSYTGSDQTFNLPNYFAVAEGKTARFGDEQWQLFTGLCIPQCGTHHKWGPCSTVEYNLDCKNKLKKLFDNFLLDAESSRLTSCRVLTNFCISKSSSPQVPPSALYFIPIFF